MYRDHLKSIRNKDEHPKWKIIKRSEQTPHKNTRMANGHIKSAQCAESLVKYNLNTVYLHNS